MVIRVIHAFRRYDIRFRHVKRGAGCSASKLVGFRSIDTNDASINVGKQNFAESSFPY